MEDRQVVSVVMASMALRVSCRRLATPGPMNSITLFLTYPLLNSAPTRAMATSWGPQPAGSAPVRYTATTPGQATS